MKAPGTKRTIRLNERLMLVPWGAVAYKYADPTEDARWLYDDDEAERIAHEDPSLVVWPDDVER